MGVSIRYGSEKTDGEDLKGPTLSRQMDTVNHNNVRPLRFTVFSRSPDLLYSNLDTKP